MPVRKTQYGKTETPATPPMVVTATYLDQDARCLPAIRLLLAPANGTRGGRHAL